VDEEPDNEEPVDQQDIPINLVFYFEELTKVEGDPDLRAYVYYDNDIDSYVFKGTRRSLRAKGKKTIYPDIKLTFSSVSELSSFISLATGSSYKSRMNTSIFAMSSETVKNATFSKIYALPARGHKTEIFGYDDVSICSSTIRDYLYMVRSVNSSESSFVKF